VINSEHINRLTCTLDFIKLNNSFRIIILFGLFLFFNYCTVKILLFNHNKKVIYIPVNTRNCQMLLAMHVKLLQKNHVGKNVNCVCLYVDAYS